MSIAQHKTGPRVHDPLVSIVLPVYNEVLVLEQLLAGIEAELTDSGLRYEIVFVNDGSRDGSGRVLDELAGRRDCIRVVHFSRNFGHQAAVQAGMVHARGDVVVLMDSDLQDAPQAISRFVTTWREGYDVVYAVRTNRKENVVKRALFTGFYRLLSSIASTPLPLDAGNFGLLDRRVIDQVLALGERDRYFPGLRSWVGFRQTGIEVERNARYDGTPRVSIWGLWRLAKTAVFSFSTFPLSIFYVIGYSALGIFVLLCSFSLYCKLFTQLAVPGWTSHVVIGCFFGALNALGVSILGEYVIRIYDQVRGRPLFVIDRITQSTKSNAMRSAADGTPAAIADVVTSGSGSQVWLCEQASEVCMGDADQLCLDILAETREQFEACQAAIHPALPGLSMAAISTPTESR